MLLELLKAFLFAGAFAGFLGVELHWTSGLDFLLLPKRGWIICAALLLCFLLRRKRESCSEPYHWSLVGPLLGMLLYLGTDLSERHGSFLLDSPALPLLLPIGIVLGLLYFFLHSFYFHPGSERKAALFTLLAVQVGIFALFLDYSKGQLIFSDDHPSFLYRIQLLLKHFPHIPFYNPQWNAGYRAAEFPVVGALGYFLLTWPLFAMSGNVFTPEGGGVYTFALAVVFLIIVPWACYFSARVFRFSRFSACLSALFALGPSMAFFRWLLHYGTIGFALSAGLMPLAFALSYRVFQDERTPKWRHALVLIPIALLALSWPMTGLVLLPAAIMPFFSAKALFEKGRREKIAAFVLLFVFTEGPILYLLASTSKAGQVLRSSNDSATAAPALEHAKKADNVAPALSTVQREESGLRDRLRMQLLRTNPLLVFFFPVSLWMIADKKLRFAAGFMSLWLLGFGLLGDSVKPQLEFIRFFVFLAYFVCLFTPAALLALLEISLAEFREAGSGLRRLLSASALVIICGSFALGPVQVWAAYTNRAEDKYIFAPKELAELSTAITEHVPEGRAFFSGFILHDFGASAYDVQDGGHIAPLAMFSGRELYASHFFHVYWQNVDPIPLEFLARDRDGVEEFLDLINAHAMLTFNKVWRGYCERSENYELKAQVGRFRLFSRRTSSNYFLKGSGDVRTTEAGFTVLPKEGELILKYRYLPSLRLTPVEAKVEMYPVPVFKEKTLSGNFEQVNFVGLHVSEEFLQTGRWLELK